MILSYSASFYCPTLSDDSVDSKYQLIHAQIHKNIHHRLFFVIPVTNRGARSTGDRSEIADRGCSKVCGCHFQSFNIFKAFYHV